MAWTLDPRRHPLVERDVASLEHEAELLAVHPAGLVEAVIEVDEDALAVSHDALDVLLDRRRGPGPEPALGRLDLARAEPAGEEVEEMHAVLDEDAAALRPVPEPVFRPEVLVGGIILEGPVDQLAQHLGFDQAADRVATGL